MILYPKCDCVIEGFRRTSVTTHVLLTHSIFFLKYFLFDSLEYTNLSCLKRGLIQNKKWFYFCPIVMFVTSVVVLVLNGMGLWDSSSFKTTNTHRVYC